MKYVAVLIGGPNKAEGEWHIMRRTEFIQVPTGNGLADYKYISDMECANGIQKLRFDYVGPDE